MLTTALRRAVLLTCVLSSAAITAQAQGGVVIRSVMGTGSPAEMVAFKTAMPIDENAIRDIIAQHEPGLAGDTSAHQLTIVVDNAGNYLRSNARTATVVRAEPGQVLTFGATTAPGVVTIRRAGSADSASAMPAMIGMMARSTDEGGSAAGFMGLDVAPSNIDSIGTKHFAPGTMIYGDLFVTVVKLKN